MTFEDYLVTLENNSTPPTLEEVGKLITYAQDSHTDNRRLWGRLYNALDRSTLFDEKQLKELVTKARIISDIGFLPIAADEWVDGYLKINGHAINYQGVMNQNDPNFILNEMKLMMFHHRLFPVSLVESAFDNWREVARKKVLARGYDQVRFDPKADAEELWKFADFIADDHSMVDATTVVLANFIHRTKNHMRGHWTHSTHLMPVLYGEQGSCKTFTIEHFLSPIREFYSVVGFELFDDNSKMYDLSVMPVMFMDEMSGVSKSDVEKVKGVMHAECRLLRQAYGKAVTRTLVSSFIGATNRDISTLLRDETGNRRVFQIETPRLSRGDVAKFDMLAIWRSVNEDAAAPLYVNESALEAVTVAQQSQRYTGPVERWLRALEVGDEDDPWVSYADKQLTAGTLFKGYFKPWLDSFDPGEARQWSDQKLGRELSRLSRDKTWIVKGMKAHKSAGNAARYSLIAPKTGGK